MLATTGGAIGINVNTTGQVVLDGLTIEGTGLGATGILSTGTGNLIVRNCLISGFTNAGIAYTPNGSSSIVVQSVTVNNIAGVGINIAPSSLTSTDIVQATILADTSLNTTGIQVIGDGLNASGVILAVIQNGTTNGNNTGINVQSSGAITNVFVRNQIIQGNSVGLALSGSASNGLSLTIGADTIAANLTPVTATGTGTLNSFRDNYLADNKNGAAATTLINKY